VESLSTTVNVAESSATSTSWNLLAEAQVRENLAEAAKRKRGEKVRELQRMEEEELLHIAETTEPERQQQLDERTRDEEHHKKLTELENEHGEAEKERRILEGKAEGLKERAMLQQERLHRTREQSEEHTAQLKEARKKVREQQEALQDTKVTLRGLEVQAEKLEAKREASQRNFEPRSGKQAESTPKKEVGEKGIGQLRWKKKDSMAGSMVSVSSTTTEQQQTRDHEL